MGLGNPGANGGMGTGDIDTSAELAAILTDESGSGSVVFGTAAAKVILGTSAAGAGSAAVSVGPSASAAGADSVVIGSTASGGAGQDKVVIGAGAEGGTTGTDNVVIGTAANAGDAASQIVIVGTDATSAANGVAVGFSADATGTAAIAIGLNAQATATDCIAIGETVSATTGTGNIAIGSDTSATGTSGAIAIGDDAASTTGARNLAIGYSADATGGNGSIAIGGNAQATSASGASIAVGDGAQALGVGSIAMANGVTGTGADYSIAIGNGSSTNNNNADHAIAIGYTATATAARAVSIGYNPQAGATGTVCIGDVAIASGVGSIAIGDAATCSTFTNALAIGTGATAAANNDAQFGTSTDVLNFKTYGTFRQNAQALTAGTMTGTVTAQTRKVWHQFSWTNAMVTALGATTTGEVTVCTLPAKTIVTNAYVVIATAAAGVTTLTVSVGRTGGAYIDYIVASDAKAAANTVYGDGSAERGTGLTGYDLPSYTGTTDVKAQFISSGDNLSAVTTSTGHVYLETIILP